MTAHDGNEIARRIALRPLDAGNRGAPPIDDWAARCLIGSCVDCDRAVRGATGPAKVSLVCRKVWPVRHRTITQTGVERADGYRNAGGTIEPPTASVISAKRLWRFFGQNRNECWSALDLI